MLARICFAVAVSSIALAAPAHAKDKSKPPATPQEISCDGVFGLDSSEALVRETFGDANVVTGPVPGPEGTEYVATTVFPDDPDRTMQFSWFDEENNAYLGSVRLSPSQAAPGGVRLGMTAAEVEALNGEPFIVGGFWWDYGGYANISSGGLADLDGECFLSLRFSPADDYPEDLDVTAISGEVEVSSDDPLLEQVGARVQVMSLGYAWPEELPEPQY